VNPLLLAATLAVIPVPPGTPAPTRTVVHQLRLLTVPADSTPGWEAPLAEAQLLALAATAFRAAAEPAPRVATTEGQTARILAGHSQTFTTGVEAGLKDGQVVVSPKTTTVYVGEQYELTGRASADGATVTTQLAFRSTRVRQSVPVVPVVVPPLAGEKEPTVVTLQVPEVDTVTINKTVVIPAGRTVVIPGPVRVQEERSEFGPPFLSKIPYLNRMFVNVGVGRVSVRTYLLVSAQVVEGEPAVPVAPAPRPVGR
jgi:type II secretory pathway component HofQ